MQRGMQRRRQRGRKIKETRGKRSGRGRRVGGGGLCLRRLVGTGHGGKQGAKGLDKELAASGFSSQNEADLEEVSSDRGLKKGAFFFMKKGPLFFFFFFLVCV